MANQPQSDGASAVLSRPMTLPQIAELLGMPGTTRAAAARLHRYIRKREKIVSEAILLQRGGPHQVRFTVTLARLREFCPELFDTRVETTELIRTHVAGIEERLVQLERQEEALADELLRITTNSD